MTLESVILVCIMRRSKAIGLAKAMCLLQAHGAYIFYLHWSIHLAEVALDNELLTAELEQENIREEHVHLLR
jgi:hypothetical protein